MELTELRKIKSGFNSENSLSTLSLYLQQALNKYRVNEEKIKLTYKTVLPGKVGRREMNSREKEKEIILKTQKHII